MLINIQTQIMIKFPVTTYPQPAKYLVLSAMQEQPSKLIYSWPS